jgi:CDP-glucose 4,6-dehydratase
MGEITELYVDIRDTEEVHKFISVNKPAVILHLADQPLVIESYSKPEDTFDINVMGTVNVLSLAFRTSSVKSVGIVTTDKVYRNDNIGRRFIETDSLGGKDPYSASKVAVEEVVSAWQNIHNLAGGPRLVSLRAGNVIGGGDFAEIRLLPDIVRGR